MIEINEKYFADNLQNMNYIRLFINVQLFCNYLENEGTAADETIKISLIKWVF